MVLVVIDGLDASGKSTQADMLAKRLMKDGKSCLIRTHPSDDNFFGVKGREYLFLEGKKAHIAASLFYLADVIRSIVLYRWRKIDYIIFVRYLLGTAYLPSPLHRFAYLFFSRVVPTSKHMYYLNVSPQEAHRRIVRTRARMERFENIEELVTTNQKALGLVRNGSWKILNGDESPDRIHNRILECIRVSGY